MTIRTGLEKRIRDLEELIYLGQSSIESLLPEPIGDMLRSSRRCSTFAELVSWHDATTQKLLELADVRPGREMGDFPHLERAVCPVCGSGSAQPYVKGFRYPEGLLMHLRGERNARECQVIRFYRECAKDRLRNPDPRKVKPDLSKLV